MASTDDKRKSRWRKRPGDDDETPAVAVAAPASMPAWLRLVLAFGGLVLVTGATAFTGAWMGIRSVESEINYGPQELEEEDESASLPPLTLVRGLDIAMERPLPRGGVGNRFLRGLSAWAPRGWLTESASRAPLEPDQAREVESPMVPRDLADTRVDRDPVIVSEAAGRAGRLGGTEALNVPAARARNSGTGETMLASPANPGVRSPVASPVDGVPASTISPPSVYNDAIGVPGRNLPLPYAAEHSLPTIQPPADASPLEARDEPGWRQRGLVP